MPTLADLYSYIDTKKRQIKNVLSDPVEAISAGIYNFGEDNKRLNRLAEIAYPMPGQRSVLVSPEERDAAQRELADAGAAMGMGATVAKQFVYPQQKALDTAQRNAVDMLGLPANNTPMDRARALGYTDDVYHGTAFDVPRFDVSKSGEIQKADWGTGAYVTPSTSNADYYATETAKRINTEVDDAFKAYEASERGTKTINGVPQYSEESIRLLKAFQDKSRELNQIAPQANTLPLLFNPRESTSYVVGSGMTDPYLAQQSADKGYGAVKIFNNQSPESLSEIVVTKPSLLRSRFAAFDPARINENDLLAGALPFGLLADEENRKKLNKLQGMLK